MPQYVEEANLLMIQEHQVSTTIKVFQLIDDELVLSSRQFCSPDNLLFRVDHLQAKEQAESHQL